jgi:hypothetical protein
MSVGVTGSLIIAGIGLGAKAATDWHASNQAKDVNRASIAAQSKTDTATATQATQNEADRAAEAKAAREQTQLLHDQDLAAKQKAYDAGLALDKQRYDAYVAANTPYWALGSKLLGSLYNMAQPGGASSGAPAMMLPPTAGGPAGGTPPMAGQGAGAPPPTLMDLARGGAPQDLPPPGTSGAPSLGVALAASQGSGRRPPLMPMTPQGTNGLSLMDLARMVAMRRGGVPVPGDSAMTE